MNISTGKILTSSASIDDPFFDKAVIFITEHNEKGTTAFVVNKIFERPLNALEAFSSSPAFPLYHGGPVDNEHLFFIHRRNDLIPGGTKIINGIYLGGDFKQTIIHINNKTITKQDIKIFLGYCGWDNKELEAELAEGSWDAAESDCEIVFS